MIRLRDIPSNPMEDILNSVSEGQDSQPDEFKVNEVSGQVHDRQFKEKITSLIQGYIGDFRKDLPAKQQLI